MDVTTLVILFAFAPCLALLWYFYNKDKYEPEPLKYVALTFLYGATISTALAMFVENMLSLIIPTSALTLALIASVVEEPAKALAIRIPYKDNQMDGVMDGVVYGVAAGLGFAATENLLYGLGYGAGVTIIRAFLTPIAHASWSAVVGVGYGLKAEGWHNLTTFFIAAMLLHFTWDYSVFMSSINPIYTIFVFSILILNIAIVKYLLKIGLIEDKIKYG